MVLKFSCTKLMAISVAALFVFFLQSAVNAQGNNINDSLVQVSKDGSLPDSIRFQAINMCYVQYSYATPDSMLPLIEYHYVLAKDKNNNKEVVNSFNEKAYAFFVKGESEKAMGFLKQSLEVLIPMDDKKNIARQYNNLASIYDQQNKYLEALKYYHSSLSYLTEIGDVEALATIYNNIGLIYYNIDELDVALENLNHSIDLFEELDIKDKFGDTWTVVGSIFLKKKEYEKAKSYGRIALNLLRSQNNMTYLAETYSLFSKSYFGEGEIDSAMHYADKRLEIFENIGNKEQVLASHILIASITAETDLDKAIDLGKKNIELIKTNKKFYLKVDAYDHLYKCYKEKGMNKESLEMYEKYVTYKDSLQIEKDKLGVIRESIRQETDLQISQTESENNQARTALQSKYKWTLIGLLGIGLLILGVGFYFYRRNNSKNLQERQVLLDQIGELKNAAAASSISVSSGGFKLDQAKIHNAIGRELNETDWNVLNILLNDPVISNKEIATKAFKSVDGIGSSLRRMYTFFEIKESKYKKISLLMEAIKISNNPG